MLLQQKRSTAHTARARRGTAGSGMSCDWGTSACASSSPLATAAAPALWRYNRTICTGLGDRLGALLTVAALAHVARVEVEMEWCDDPSAVYPQMRAHMPNWFGYNYPLDHFLQSFEIPPDVRLVARYSSAALPEISYTGNELPAEDAHDQLYTLAHRTTRLGQRPLPPQDFVRAYHVVGDRLRPKLLGPTRGHVVLHMRGIDANLAGTFRDFKRDWDPSLFCTHRVVSSALKRGLKVVAIGLDLAWARGELQGFGDRVTFAEGTAFEDMALMLSAAGIIQHAPRGYSSYSSVPSMAKGIPLISTYKGPLHRLEQLQQSGELPSEFYTCSERKAFLARVAAHL